MRRLTTLPAILIAVALSACAGQDGPRVETKDGASVNIYPDAYKAEVLAYLRNYLNDLSGIRDAGVSVPVVRPIGGVERYVVCVHFSARTPGASPSGRDYIAIFLAGKLDQMAATRDQCGGATYEPFPELERLRR